MVTRLRNLKQKMKGVKLSDDKALGVANRLSDKRIDQLQQYYGQAMRNNSGNLQEMRKATFCHLRLSDKNLHQLCQIPGVNITYESTLSSFKHTNTLPIPVSEAIRHIYKALVNPVLLRKW